MTKTYIIYKAEQNVDGSQELNLEDLEGISGGNCTELSNDSSVLKSLGLCNYYGYFDLCRCPGHCQEIVNAWKNAGVDCRFSDLVGNEYYIDGKKVSRNDAINYVKNR